MAEALKNEVPALIFNVLIRKEKDYFVAHCLELDIVTTAATAEEVQTEIIDLVDAQIGYAFTHNNLDNLYHPAPPEIWREYFACRDSWEKKKEVEPRFHDADQDNFVPPWIITRMCQSLNCHV